MKIDKDKEEQLIALNYAIELVKSGKIEPEKIKKFLGLINSVLPYNNVIQVNFGKTTEDDVPEKNKRVA
ncbi:MAG: hypothetical protein ACI9QD_001219 [Thermoproteota archaeon]|jgi:hypothetical protein